MKNFAILFPTLFFLAFIGCKKPKDDGEKMPAPTQSGQNIVAFKVNGQIHIYNGIATYLDDNGVNFLISDYTDSSKSLIIIADDKKYNDEMLCAVTFKTLSTIINPSFNTPYYLGKKHVEQSFYFIGNGNHKYYPDSTTSYVIFTRFDNIAAGTFEFHGQNDSNQKIDITEGYFDIKR